MNDPFRKRGRNGPVLSRDEGQRQGRAVRAAQAALGSVDAVRAFLNTHHASLDARPIDLAVASEAGLAAVEAAISAEAQEGEWEAEKADPDVGPPLSPAFQAARRAMAAVSYPQSRRRDH